MNVMIERAVTEVQRWLKEQDTLSEDMCALLKEQDDANSVLIDIQHRMDRVSERVLKAKTETTVAHKALKEAIEEGV